MFFNEQEKEVSEINVIPFIDIMLVLLIIFMVVTPIITSSIHVELPKSSQDSKRDKSKPIILYINEKNELAIGDIKLDINDIKKILDEKSKSNKEEIIYFHVDKFVNYEKLMEIINKVKESGYSKIALSTAVADSK